MTAADHSRRPRPIAALLAVSIAVATASCSEAPSGETEALTTTMCRAVRAQTAVTARDAFADAHDGLHTLARDLQEGDAREAAADLLEAKVAVEQDVASDAALDELRPHLEALLDTVQQADAALERPATRCP